MSKFAVGIVALAPEEVVAFNAGSMQKGNFSWKSPLQSSPPRLPDKAWSSSGQVLFGVPVKQVISFWGMCP